MVLTMRARGMQVDLSHFEKLGRTLADDMEKVGEDVLEVTGHRINVDSPQQVSKLLFKTLGLKQARPKFTASDEESTGEEVLLAIQHDHPVVPKILEYRELSKLKGTYVDPLPKLAKRTKFGQWRMFPDLGTTRVPSGRFNCKKPNLLAMPTRTRRGRDIRMGFITDPGWVYLSVDESQIEVRVAAHCTGDKRLISIYENEEDIYSDFAITAFRLQDNRHQVKGKWVYPHVDKLEHRFPAKTCVLASIYEVSPKGLLEQMPIVCKNCGKLTASDDPSMPLHDCGHFQPLWTETKCEDLLRKFYQAYPGILEDRALHHKRAQRHGYIWDMWGRIAHTAATRSVHKWVVGAALREAGNVPYQGGANGTLKLTMARVHDIWEEGGYSDVSWPLLPIHDELLFECREDIADEWMALVVQCFEESAPLKVPIKASGSWSPAWGSISK